MWITLDLWCTCEYSRLAGAQISTGTGMTYLYLSAQMHVYGVVQRVCPPDATLSVRRGAVANN